MPMPRAANARELFDVTGSVRLTLPQARELMNDPPASLSDKQKRRLAEWVARRETATRERQQERYTATVELLTQRREQMAEDLDTLTEWAEEIKDDLENGRTTAAEAQDMLTRIFRAIGQVRERIDGTRQDDEAAWAMVQSDAGDFEGEQLRRFPMLSRRLPTLSHADLNGNEG